MYSILLSDDEHIFLDYMKSILSWEDYKCKTPVCTYDGKGTLDYLFHHQVDIAFIDISMPKIDGITVCEKVKEANLSTKLIIMTGHDEFEYAYKAIKLHVDDYLLKPFTKEELVVALKKVLKILGSGYDSPESNAIGSMNEGATKYEIITFAINEYLEKNYGDSTLSLTSIADNLGFESSYIRRIYKYTTGMTIMQKLEELRIQAAKVLLEQGNMKQQEIAERTGFSDQFYFSKRFKQICGISPSEYKKTELMG